MKPLKFTLIILVAVLALIASLWVGGLIDAESAKTTGSRAVGVILLLGIAFQLISSIARKPSDSDASQSDEPGPKF